MSFGFVDPIAKLLGDWSIKLGVWSILFRIALAVILASIVGWERSSKRHSAGLRTFIVITLASTIASIIDQSMSILPILSTAVIIATSSLSGNSILFGSKNQIKGLTTSAGLWACSIIGIAIGSGMYTVVVVGFIAVESVLAFFPSIERNLKNRSNHFEIHLELKNKDSLGTFVETIRRLGLRIDDIEADTAYMGSGLSVYSVTLSIMSPELKKYKTHHEIIEALKTLDYVSHVEEMS